MEEITLIFNWKNLDSCQYQISEEKRRRIQEIVVESAKNYYPSINVGDGLKGLSGLEDGTMMIFFYDKPSYPGMHAVSDGIEFMGLNNSLLESEGRLACRSRHEFRHSYDVARGALPPYCYRGSKEYIKTQIRARVDELMYLFVLPKSMWKSKKERREYKHELVIRLAKNCEKLLLKYIS